MWLILIGMFICCYGAYLSLIKRDIRLFLAFGIGSLFYSLGSIIRGSYGASTFWTALAIIMFYLYVKEKKNKITNGD
jgi:hypothetical protein